MPVSSCNGPQASVARLPYIGLCSIPRASTLQPDCMWRKFRFYMPWFTGRYFVCLYASLSSKTYPCGDAHPYKDEKVETHPWTFATTNTYSFANAITHPYPDSHSRHPVAHHENRNPLPRSPAGREVPGGRRPTNRSGTCSGTICWFRV